MTLHKFAALGLALGLAAGAFAGPEPSTASPPRKGEKIAWPGPWRTKQTLHGAEKFLAASTSDPMRFFKTPVRVTNEGMEMMLEKPTKFPPNRATNPPAIGSEFGIATQPLATSWEGIGQTTLTPPDNDMAVGDNYVVSVVNSTWRISDKCGNTLYENTINNFLSDGGFFFDPKVFFDPWRRRWSMLWHRQNSNAATSHLVTVSSDNDDPFGTWWIYYFNVSSGGSRWVDYCDWGYGANSVDAGGNMFTFGNSFINCRFFTFNPAEIYEGAGASVVWNDFATNPDGSQAFAPRVAKQMNFGLGGSIFMNSRVGGGSKLTEWLLADPLGARNWTYYDINVSAYSIPPDAFDPGGNQIQTNNCQMMPVYNMFHAASGKWRMYTSLNSANPSQGGTCAARLYILDPFARTVEMDWNFWPGGGNSFFYASPSVNYNSSCNWIVSYAGPGVRAGAYFTNFEPTGFTNTISAVRSGDTNYGGSRWGDYHGGSMDWGDYFASSASQKMWMTGEYADTFNAWGTFNAAAVSAGYSAGTMSVTGATSMTFSGYVGGGFSPSSYTNNVANTGSVGFNWNVTTPSWLSADVTGSQLFSGGSQGVNVGPNGGTNGLPFGKHTSNVTYMNCYNNATVNVPATVYAYGLVLPSSYSITLGRLASGNLASLGSVDSNFFTVCKFIVPNSTVPPVRVEINGTAPGNNVGYVDFITYVKMATAGLFVQTMEMWNYNTNNWDAVNFRADTVNTGVQRFDLFSSGNHNRYIGPANALKARYSIKPSGPVASQNWCSQTDFAGWIIAPIP